MANKLKPYIPVVLGERKPRGTRLAAELNKLSEGVDDPDLQRRAIIAAAQLDRTCAALGAKGERVKGLQAYRVAVQCYQEITGEDYVG